MAAPEVVRVGEADYGVSAYLTRTPPLGGRLKVRHEDFQVEELGPAPPRRPAGPLTAAWVRLTNRETHGFVRDAAARLGISRRGIHFAGTKDKRAVTTQWFTLRVPPGRAAELASLRGVEVLEAYPTDRERVLGDHTGNRFHVTVRALEEAPDVVTDRIEEVRRQLEAAGGFPNFFGPQRFGSLRPTTHRVGRHLVRGEFAQALAAYVATPGPDEPSDLAAARRLFAEGHDPRRALKAFEGTGADFERALLNALVQRPDDPLGAFAALPPNLRTLFVFAYQSFLFNQVVSRRIAAGLPLAAPVPGDLVAPLESGNVREDWLPVSEANLDRAVQEARRGRLATTGPLYGTHVPLAQEAPGRLERQVLVDEGVQARDFLIPEAPRLSSKGTRRPLSVAMPPVTASVAPDPNDPGRTQATFVFDLPKGVYATVLLREFLKATDVAAYG